MPTSDAGALWKVMKTSETSHETIRVIGCTWGRWKRGAKGRKNKNPPPKKKQTKQTEKKLRLWITPPRSALMEKKTCMESFSALKCGCMRFVVVRSACFCCCWWWYKNGGGKSSVICLQEIYLELIGWSRRMLFVWLSVNSDRGVKYESEAR